MFNIVSHSKLLQDAQSEWNQEKIQQMLKDIGKWKLYSWLGGVASTMGIYHSGISTAAKDQELCWKMQQMEM